MELFGTHDPEGGDGYAPGAFDEVKAAFLDGHLSEEAYDLIRVSLCGPITVERVQEVLMQDHDCGHTVGHNPVRRPCRSCVRRAALVVADLVAR